MRVSSKRSAWARRSEDVSTRIVAPLASRTRIDGRERLSRGSVDWQTAQRAANHRHAHRRAGAEKRDFHWTGAERGGTVLARLVSALRQGMMMRDFSGAATPSLVASMYFRRSS